MGGDRISPLISSNDEESSLEQEFQDYPFESTTLLSYNPGAWTEKVGGMKLSDYNVPNTTSLPLIGPERSGKSSPVNRISKVFDDDKFAPERAQVSYDPYVEGGTYFLQEYMIPSGSTSFCLYDTRSLSDNASENMEMLKRWMTDGVRHGELVSRNSDDPSLKTRLKCKAHKNHYCYSEIRMVNFVIFVVSGLSVLNSMETGEEAEGGYNKMIATMFNCPFLSFRDDKPAVVVTHGDLLSLSDRACVRFRVHLEKLLENCDPTTELTIIDVLRYSLGHGDKNLPGRHRFIGKVIKVPQSRSLLLALILGIAIISALVHDAYSYSGHRHHAPQTDAPIDWNANNAPQTDTALDWNSIRYLWLG